MISDIKRCLHEYKDLVFVYNSTGKAIEEIGCKKCNKKYGHYHSGSKRKCYKNCYGIWSQ